VRSPRSSISPVQARRIARRSTGSRSADSPERRARDPQSAHGHLRAWTTPRSLTLDQPQRSIWTSSSARCAS
jgi:hypothetical protein